MVHWNSDALPRTLSVFCEFMRDFHNPSQTLSNIKDNLIGDSSLSYSTRRERGTLFLIFPVCSAEFESQSKGANLTKNVIIV